MFLMVACDHNDCFVTFCRIRQNRRDKVKFCRFLSKLTKTLLYAKIRSLFVVFCQFLSPTFSAGEKVLIPFVWWCWKHRAPFNIFQYKYSVSITYLYNIFLFPRCLSIPCVYYYYYLCVAGCWSLWRLGPFELESLDPTWCSAWIRIGGLILLPILSHCNCLQLNKVTHT